jgi:hypothetical protein
MATNPHLDAEGQRLLALLVSRLPNAIPNDPRTFISYKDAHTYLGLDQIRETFGESLKAQGLTSLADWTAETTKPGITGLIIDRGLMVPGKGYFTLFGKKEDDFTWWAAEIVRSKNFDWSPFLPAIEPPAPPIAVDIEDPPGRQEITIYRVLRDSLMARRVKQLHNYECQLCGHTILLPGGVRYAEAHHIQPLGEPHNGPDQAGNIVCVCPNHHAELDYGARPLDISNLRHVVGHVVATSPRFSVALDFRVRGLM